MKQLLILSGKGGTGKTTITSAFVHLSAAKFVADCDVEAPNLHLVTHFHSLPTTKPYYGLMKASIDPNRCIGCQKCKDACRFDAISCEDVCSVNSYLCEGCGVCEYVCPVGAVAMQKSEDGELLLAEAETVFSSAKLRMGSGNSGLLVSEVKKQLSSFRPDNDLILIDGAPGIGCPVIASISGVDFVLLVAEPSVSGINDLKRIVITANHFRVPVAICVNKYDIHPENTEAIIRYANAQHIPFVGVVPYDPEVVKANDTGLNVMDTNGPASKAIQEIFQRTIYLIAKDAS